MKLGEQIMEKGRKLLTKRFNWVKELVVGGQKETIYRVSDLNIASLQVYPKEAYWVPCCL